MPCSTRRPARRGRGRWAQRPHLPRPTWRAPGCRSTSSRPATPWAGAPPPSTPSGRGSTSAAATTGCSAPPRWPTSWSSPTTGCATSRWTPPTSTCPGTAPPPGPSSPTPTAPSTRWARLHPAEVAGYRRYLADTRPVAELVLEVASGPPTPGRVARLLAGRHASASLPAALEPHQRRQRAALLLQQRGPAWRRPSRRVPRSGGSRPTRRARGWARWATRSSTWRRWDGPWAAAAPCPPRCRGAAAAGGTVHTGRRVQAILCEGDGVVGVELDGGERMDADVVVSAVDPYETFVTWLRHPPPAALGLVRRWRGATRPRRLRVEARRGGGHAAPAAGRGGHPGPARRAWGRRPAVATVVVAPPWTTWPGRTR